MSETKEQAKLVPMKRIFLQFEIKAQGQCEGVVQDIESLRLFKKLEDDIKESKTCCRLSAGIDDEDIPHVCDNRKCRFMYRALREVEIPVKYMKFAMYHPIDVSDELKKKIMASVTPKCIFTNHSPAIALEKFQFFSNRPKLTQFEEIMQRPRVMKQVREIISARMIELNRPGIAVMDSLVLLFVAKIIPWIPQSCVDELSRFAMPSDQKILNSLMIMRYPAFDAAIGEVIDREIDREINVSVGPTLQ